MTRQQATTTPPPKIAVEMPRSRVNAYSCDTVRIATIFIECDCSQCEQIEKNTWPSFRSFDFSNYSTIQYTRFNHIDRPHLAAYAQCTQAELTREVMEKALDDGWKCYLTREAWVELLPNGCKRNKMAQYKWISPQHAEYFGDGQ